MKNHSKKYAVDIFYNDVLVYHSCPFSIWMSWSKYYTNLIEKKAIKTTPTKEEYKMLFTDFVNHIN